MTNRIPSIIERQAWLPDVNVRLNWLSSGRNGCQAGLSSLSSLMTWVAAGSVVFFLQSSSTWNTVVAGSGAEDGKADTSLALNTSCLNPVKSTVPDTVLVETANSRLLALSEKSNGAMRPLVS